MTRLVLSKRNFSLHNVTRAFVRRQNKRRKDAQDRPCPTCLGPTSSVASRRRYGKKIQERLCAKRHISYWDADMGGLLGRGYGNGRSITGTPRALPGDFCYFPGCNRRRCSCGGGRLRWCQGHAKQRVRHGVANMKPLSR